jgi:type IV pilus assembly protein PilQ
MNSQPVRMHSWPLSETSASPARCAAEGRATSRAAGGYGRSDRRRLFGGALVGALFALASFSVPASAATAAVHVSDVTISAPTEDAAVVSVATNAEPKFSARVTDGGTRLVVDLSDADLAGAPPALTKGNKLVAGVMTQAFQSGGEGVTRVIVTFARPVAYRVRVAKSGLAIDLTAAEKTEAMGASAPAPAKSADGATSLDANVSNVRFEHKDGVDRVIVDLSAVPKWTESHSGGRSTLELSGVKLPAALQRTLDVGAFGGPVKQVSTYRRQSDPTRVVIDVERASETGGSVSREGNSLVFSFGAGLHSMQSGVAADGGAARRARTVAREAASPADTVPPVTTNFEAAGGARESTSEPDQADAFMPAVAGQQQHRFNGRRVDLDLKDADIHNVLRLFADVGRVNIITADNVTGNVTIRVKNVPWDQALDTILQAKNLGMVRNGNMLRIAPAADLNKERELAIARRKAELQLAPVETRLIPVSYAAANDLQTRAKDMLSPRGTMAVDDRTNVIIARDVAGNLNQIEELVRSLDTQTPQVLVEARIVEATSRYLRDAGIQWGGDATFSAATGNPTGAAFPSSIGLAGGASDGNAPTAGLSPFQSAVTTPNYAVNLPSPVGTGQGGALGLTFGSINNTVNLSLRLSAAEASGMLRIVSSPRVLTMDNKDARISQGTLIPFSQVSAQGVQTTFQEAKLQLLVKPHVTAEGSISMHVKINRDEPDFNQTSARGDPTILKREAETDLLVVDGHTAVIGGIFTRNSGRNLDQVPILGDIPILGVLFQRRRTSDIRGELVIFLTPRIVNRAEALGR